MVESNPLQYYFLREVFGKVVKKEQEVIKVFNVSNGINKIVVLFTNDVCVIYDDNYDETLIPLLSKELEFEKFNSYQFAGSKQTIDKLFELNNAKYLTQKHRITYKCSKVIDSITLAPGSIEMGNISRFEELVSLSIGFAKEYYGVENSVDEAASFIISGMQQNSIYQWVNNDRVCAMAQNMYGDYDFPVIGHFYTNPQERNKGYGTSIIHALTKGLLEEGRNEFVMLQTNALTPQPNRVFEKVGYYNVGEYLKAYKYKD